MSTSSVLDVLLRDRDITALISDIDGTISHYSVSLRKLSYEQVSETAFEGQESKKTTTLKEEAEETTWQAQMEALLARAFPPSARASRFANIPYEYWQHEPTQTMHKSYVVYNSTLSSTMGRCLISENTVLLMELLQRPSLLYAGLLKQEEEEKNTNTNEDRSIAASPVLCALITGARTATYEGRRRGGALPLVSFDAYEGGGKIVCRLQPPASSPEEGTPAEPVYIPNEQIREASLETAWMEQFAAVTGYKGTSTNPPTTATTTVEVGERRRGPLWDLMYTLEKEGFHVDNRSYETSFLIDFSKSPCVAVATPSSSAGEAKEPSPGLHFSSCEAAEQYLIQLLSTNKDVEIFVNLGKAQVNARGSGKLGAMQYILDTAAARNKTKSNYSTSLLFCPAQTVALFDDNNDLPFAKACGVGFLPSVAHSSVLAQEELRGPQPKWLRPPWDGLLGSEWSLWQVVVFKRNRYAKRVDTTE